MSDIAMLVAEEYERRVKYCRKRGEEIELFSSVGVFMENTIKLSSSSSSLMREKMVDVFDRGFLQPKSQIALAAATSLFSA